MITRAPDHAVLRTQLQEARWLLRSLEIRNDTMLRVARTIVERQQAFLDRGEESMQPMILKDVAEAVDMHESTISRVTTGKYLHTPRGVFEFRFFFSSQVPAEDGTGISSTAIRARSASWSRRNRRITRCPTSSSWSARATASRWLAVRLPSTAKRSA